MVPRPAPGGTTDDTGTVEIRTAYDDGTLRYPIAADVSLTSVTRVTSVTVDGRSRAVILPDGGALWEVVMHWTADPAIVLSGCQIGIEGVDGRFWERRYPDLFDAGSTTLPFSPCVPDDAPGPQVKLDLGRTTGEGGGGAAGRLRRDQLRADGHRCGAGRGAGLVVPSRVRRAASQALTTGTGDSPSGATASAESSDCRMAS